MRRGSIIAVLFVPVLALLAGGCGSVDPAPAPPAPTMVPFANDPFMPRGIRPDPDAPNPSSPESGGIIVEWNNLTADQVRGVRVGGFYLYRSDSVNGEGRAVNFRRIASIELSQAQNDTSVADTAVRQNIRYSYYVTAYSRSDEAVESLPSDTVHYTLTMRAVPTFPLGSVIVPADRPLEFRFEPPEAAGIVAIQVYQVRPENENAIIRTMWQYIGRADFASPHLDYAGLPLVSGQRYRWRIDKILEGEPLGNASRWGTFIAQ